MQTREHTAQTGYAAAYRAHYSDKDMLEALRLYASILMHHPDTRESRDARIQIRNIVSQLATVPEIVTGDLTIAMAHITTDVPPWFTELLEHSWTRPHEGSA